jgi:hypothetical protein
VSASGNNAWQYGTGGGIIGLIVLVLDIMIFGTSHQELEMPPPLHLHAPQHPIFLCCSQH